MINEFESDKSSQNVKGKRVIILTMFFLRGKRDSFDSDKKYRMILNVKQLNTHVKYVHFKMDTLESCLS